jgi:hypothetical protein
MLFTIVVTHCPVVVLWYLNLKLVHSIRFEGYEYKRQLAAASD